MSGLLAIIDHARSATDDIDLAPMLGALAPRGDRLQVWRAADAILAATRFDWELPETLARSPLVVNDGEISVVADASLYYRDDLVQRLTAAGVRPRSAGAPHLIAAAYLSSKGYMPETINAFVQVPIWWGNRLDMAVP